MKEHTLLMIPGPIEFEPAVLAEMGAPTTSHLAPSFLEAFGQALERMRQVWQTEDGQPFILAGSGTLAMDCAGANLVEAGEHALVIDTGYFSQRYASLLERYGAKVTLVSAPPGSHPALEQVENALQSRQYKLMTITHVDTSTAVLADVPGLAALGRQYGVLVVVDGVCSLAGEELKMDEWGVDVALTASQKAIGVPPGLALLVASQSAMQAFQARQTPVGNYYADWTNWLPVMQAYQARKPSYFGTPAVNLVWALNVSLGQILKEGLEARIARHTALSRSCKAGIQALGMEQVPEAVCAAHTLSAPRYPAGVRAGEFLARVGQAGVTLAGGLYPSLRSEYFRIGHMGSASLGDILITLSAIEHGLRACGVDFPPGISLQAAQSAWAG